MKKMLHGMIVIMTLVCVWFSAVQEKSNQPAVHKVTVFQDDSGYEMQSGDPLFVSVRNVMTEALASQLSVCRCESSSADDWLEKYVNGAALQIDVEEWDVLLNEREYIHFNRILLGVNESQYLIVLSDSSVMTAFEIKDEGTKRKLKALLQAAYSVSL